MTTTHIIIACVVAVVLIGLLLQHRVEMARVRNDAPQPDDYLRGFEDGMKRAAAMVDGMHNQTPNSTISATIRNAIVKVRR